MYKCVELRSQCKGRENRVAKGNEKRRKKKHWSCTTLTLREIYAKRTVCRQIFSREKSVIERDGCLRSMSHQPVDFGLVCFLICSKGSRRGDEESQRGKSKRFKIKFTKRTSLGELNLDALQKEKKRRKK